MASKPPPWSNTPATQTEGSARVANGLPSLQSVLKRSLDASEGQKSLHVVAPGGDLILEYIDESSAAEPMCWQVASESLATKSPYFSALLHPEKFAEGRYLSQHRQGLNDDLDSQLNTRASGEIGLPKIQIPASRVIQLCGSEALGLFLQALCLDSMTDREVETFKNGLKNETPSAVAKFIHIADAFNSPSVAYDLLKNEYLFGRKDNTRAFRRFDTALLRLKEDRVRQIIMISIFLKEYSIARTMMHSLLLGGSRLWVHGVEVPSSEYLQWQYLPNGIEEELYSRRQFVLNTITDLQAHFLRVYGALEDTEEPKPAPVRPSLGLAFSTSTPNRSFQCRAGLDNASQCDLFQLGQMTRFFAMRAKTIFLGSNLLDPDFDLDDSENEADDVDQDRALAALPSDILALITSLKQFPDYQIDMNHGSCGVRRRLLPILPCIEKYLLDPGALLGIDLHTWSQQPNDQRWKKRRRQHKVEIRFEKIVKVEFPHQQPRVPLPSEDAALLFTARKRNWEA
ncbi:hypothetical protein N7468_007510 [Penicillium chermesinum]|uniref:BTB domain-containing protein n=1 Tax=Penicillium chermesinum TaxID=63820 RepID=A0A9W9NUG7_9EURO|nr:uncharacterized protein N7468_007510 [Penicillium chermesinum]KAJ5226285.1 hypothetical protein N7468_007510 [Penicillium chermesinum]KAJ6160533.1 hypothetical protein N7470_003929 [Penicillium chermesinum]